MKWQGVCIISFYIISLIQNKLSIKNTMEEQLNVL